ncbi:MAG: ribosome maturation factor RimM, partial [Christensenellaceae bacterium]
MRGKRITVPFEERMPLPEGQYYIAELIGCRVEDETGKLIGTLTDVMQAATDIYTIDTGSKEILFPVAAGVVTEVDVSAKRIVVDRKRFGEVAVL